MIFVVAGIIAIYAFVYVAYYCKKPKVFCSGEKLRSIVTKCSTLQRYFPNPLLLGGNLNSLVAANKRKRPQMTFNRELFTISDDGTAAVDWCEENQDELTDESPIFLILHGMNGGSMESYVRWICKHTIQKHWRVGVVICRGCCGLKLTTWRLYNAGWTLDMHEIVIDLHKRYPKAPIFAVGYSLGANILTKYVGEEAENCLLTAAVSVSNPIDLYGASNILENTLAGKHIYSPYITRGLVRLAVKNKEMIEQGPHKIDFEAVKKIKYQSEYDEVASCKFFGLAHAVDYYTNFQCKPYLTKIKTPMLFITSEDDPMFRDTPIKAFLEASPENENIALIATRTGGHYGFFEVRNVIDVRQWFDLKTTWTDRAIPAFCQSVLEAKVQ